MLDKETIESELKKQLALDFNCNADDFTKNENLIVVPKEHPEWRGKGIASSLVKLLKNEVFERGAIPFYGTSLSNLDSWNVALSSGFYPAWVEIATKEK